ncbi:MAG: hypothetical protein ACOCYN_00020 [Planctomycetota bacterium]
MLRPLLLLPCLFCAAALGAATGPGDWIPAEARWLVRLEVSELTRGQLGEVVQQFAKWPDVAPKLAALDAMTGFAPLRDLRTVVLCGSTAEERDALLYLSGSFDRERLEILARAGDGHTTTEVDTAVIHRLAPDPESGDPSNYACFLRDDLLVFGQRLDHVRLAVSVASGASPSAADAGTLPEAGDAPLVMIAQARGVQELVAGTPNARMLRHVKTIALRLHQTDDALVGKATLTAVSPELAQQVIQIAQGLKALAALGANEHPQLADLAGRADLSRDGAAVSLRIELPFPMVLRMLRQSLPPSAPASDGDRPSDSEPPGREAPDGDTADDPVE